MRSPGAPRRAFTVRRSGPISRSASDHRAVVAACGVAPHLVAAVCDARTELVPVSLEVDPAALLEQTPPDLLLLGWDAPAARDLLLRIRERWGRVDLPVLAIVEDPAGPDAVEALLAGATGVATVGGVDLLRALVAASLSTRLQGRWLREEAERDHLTGLFSRSYFEHRLLEEWSSCRRHGHPLSLVVGDLDNFKTVNDVHGHTAGDAAIAAFGRMLRENTRREDVAARYGGDELVLILPRTDSDGAAQLVGRVGRLLAAERFASPKGDFHVTASFGIAESHSALDTVEDLFAEADAALYAAKHAGKGRAATARRPLPPAE